MMNAPAEQAQPRLRSAESREHFAQKIVDAFLMAGDREPIGEVLDYLASAAFEDGLGRDQAARQITTSDVFERKGLVEGPLKVCIRNEIQAAYAGRRGRKEFSSEQRAAAIQSLKAFLDGMSPNQSVTGFFRDLVNGRTEAGPVLTDSVATTVAQGNLLRWAIGLKATRAIKRRFKEMVRPVIAKRFREYIKSKPEQYIANFLNDVFIIGMRGDDPTKLSLQFQIANLQELFRDIGDAVDFSTFWKIFEAHAQAASEDLQGALSLEGAAEDFLNIELWRSSVEMIWKEVKAELRQRNGDSQLSGAPPGRAVRSVSDGVRRKAAAVSRLFFVILPPGANGVAASKMTVEIQNRRGNLVGTALVKPNIRDADPTHVRRFVRNLLAGDGSIAKSLRSHGIHLDKDGPEVHALANQLGSHSPLKLSYSNGRRKRSRR